MRTSIHQWGFMMLFQLFSFICFASVRKSCIEISTDKGFLSLVYFTSHYSNGIKLAYIFLSATSLVNYGEIKHLLKQPPRYHLIKNMFSGSQMWFCVLMQIMFWRKTKGFFWGGERVYTSVITQKMTSKMWECGVKCSTKSSRTKQVQCRSL